MTKSITVFLETVFAKSIFGANIEEQGAVLRELVDYIVAGKIKTPVKKVIRGLTAESIRQAHTLLEQGDTIGKIVIDLQDKQ